MAEENNYSVCDKK